VLLSCHIKNGVGKEQRICIKFCIEVGKTAAETHNMLREAYGDDALNQTTTYEWFKSFKNGRTSTDDDERSDRSSTSRSEPLVPRRITLSIKIVD
jgi:hypothetical protein